MSRGAEWTFFPGKTYKWTIGRWCWTLPILGKWKNTVRYHLIPIRMTVFKKAWNNKCLRGFEKMESSYTAGGSVNRDIYTYMYVCVYTNTHMHTQGSTTHLKKDEILPFVITQMDFEDIMLSEISQVKKEVSYVFTHIYTVF